MHIRWLRAAVTRFALTIASSVATYRLAMPRSKRMRAAGRGRVFSKTVPVSRLSSLAQTRHR
jgi:hypothetical protein